MVQTAEQFVAVLKEAEETDAMLDVNLSLHSQTAEAWVVVMAPLYREVGEVDIEIKFLKHCVWTADEIKERCRQELVGYAAYSHLVS